MKNEPAARLRMDAQQTTLTTDSAGSVLVPIGYRAVADAFFRHDPPRPRELELAIDAVENALMSTRAPRTNAGTLLTSDAILKLLPELRPDGSAMTLDQVEALFQRLASASLGHPGVFTAMPSGRDSAAALLILRECMHHLGFVAITFDHGIHPQDGHIAS